MSGVLNDNKDVFKIALKQVFGNFNVNFCKNEGFLTSIPCIPILEYSQLNTCTLHVVISTLCLNFVIHNSHKLIRMIIVIYTVLSCVKSLSLF